MARSRLHQVASTASRMNSAPAVWVLCGLCACRSVYCDSNAQLPSSGEYDGPQAELSGMTDVTATIDDGALLLTYESDGNVFVARFDIETVE